MKQTLISKAEILDLEPNLQPFLMVVFYLIMLGMQEILITITKKLFDLFIKNGGKFIKENVIT